jgi:type I restriction enzyme, S subunit
VKKGWTEVALGELLESVSRTVRVQPDESYRLLGVRLEGNGAFHRETKLGGETSANRLDRVQDGDFIYSRLFAWRGAFSLIGPELDGAYVSNEFPIFTARKPERIDLRYLNYWFGQPRIWKIVEDDCQGSTPLTRNRYKEEFFYELRVPLPPLPEQQRLVAHLEAIKSSLTRVQKLRAEERKEKLALVTSLAHRWDLDSESKRARGWQKVTLGAVLQETSDTAAVDATASYPNIGIYSYGRGTFNKPPIDGANTSATQLFRVRAGQFIYSRLFAFEGAYALVRPSQDGHYVSNEFPSFNLDTQRILPEFLFAYFKSPAVWRELAEQSTGLGDRRQRIHPEIIQAHSINLPPIEYQAKVRDAFMKLERVGASAGEEEIDALIPSLLDRIFNS